MFSGIVEESGQVKSITRQGRLMRLEISASKVLKDTKIGDSIAVNGACLTVVALTGNSLSFDVIFQTVSHTNLGGLRPGQPVNLERALALGDRISGHFVSGHIDCVGLVRRRTLRSGSIEFEIAVEPAHLRYCYLKGSVALNGISLTVAGVHGNVFKVCVIPHTLKNTNLGLVNPSDKLNVEFDLLAKKAAV